MVYYCAGWVSIVIELLAVPLVLAQVEPLKVFNAQFVESRKLEKDNTPSKQDNVKDKFLSQFCVWFQVLD